MKEQMRAELTKDDDGNYIDWQVQISWCGFKAAWQHQQAKIDSLQAELEAQTPAQPIEPAGKNEYGLDVGYFREKLSLIIRDIGCYKPDEMYRELSRLANVLETIPSDPPQQPAQEPAAWMAPSEPKSCNVITVEHKDHLSKVESWDGYEKEYAARFTVPLYFGHQQPAQEPVAWMNESTGGFHLSEASITEYEKRSHKITALYVKPTN